MIRLEAVPASLHTTLVSHASFGVACIYRQIGMSGTLPGGCRLRSTAKYTVDLRTQACDEGDMCKEARKLVWAINTIFGKSGESGNHLHARVLHRSRGCRCFPCVPNCFSSYANAACGEAMGRQARLECD